MEMAAVSPANSPVPQKAPLPGTRPEGTADERQAAAYVREMFSHIAPRYDFLNHLLSLNLDKLWRRRTAQRFRHILCRHDARVLDLCCGTGDLAFALRKTAATEARRHGEGRGATIWGSDFSHPMLILGQRKAGAVGATLGSPAVHFVESDALNLPFPDASLDLVTLAFGFRNLANYEAGLCEILRVLKPDGEVGILEFAAPRGSLFAPLYRWYFTQVLPRVGGAVSGSKAAYSYLPRSVFAFPDPGGLCAQMRDLGLAGAWVEHWTGGIVSLYAARKP
jgi:demethylmenaquinone methyltransferase/2-methoxy-6-polyprenyl-1,4-benzoquinol methylase